MRPRVLRTRLALMAVGAVTAGAVLGTGVARADGYITPTEARYIAVNGHVVCDVLDDYPSEAGVTGIMQAIVSDGFSADSSADIVNASVLENCPRFWVLLVEIGNRARGVTLR